MLKPILTLRDGTPYNIGTRIKHCDRCFYGTLETRPDYIGKVVTIEPTVHGADYVGVLIQGEVRYFTTRDLIPADKYIKQ